MRYNFLVTLTAILFISDVTLASDAVCDISDLTLEVQACDTSDMFFVHLEFAVSDPGTMGFAVQGNGVVYDTFDYGQAFYIIGPLQGDCSTLYEFEVMDLEDNDCRAGVELNVPVCCAKECSIDIDDLVIRDCDTTGMREILFSLNTENEGSLGFDVYFLGVILEHYSYGQQSYTISIPGYNLGFLTIRDTEFPECSTRLPLNYLPCPGVPVCDPSAFQITREFMCTSDTTYNVFIMVEYSGADDSLYVSLDGEPAELRASKEFPVIYYNLEVNNDLHVFYVQEQDNPFCFNGTEWNDPPDCASFFSCGISDVFAEIHECDPQTGIGFVDIEFEIENPESDSFIVRGNGIIYDTFAYGMSFYTVGPVDFDCSTLYEFIIMDLEDPDCQGEFVFAEPLCCACEFDDVEIEVGECNAEGQYAIDIDFSFENVLNPFFDLYIDGAFVGFFAYADLPLTIEDINGGGGAVTLVEICDNDNPDCCIVAEYETPDCAEPCEIFDVFAEASACDINGQIFIVVEFGWENTGDDGFMIVGNGINYGSFQYGLANYVLGPVSPDCDLEYEFEVIDIENPDCSDFFVFDDPLCCEDLPCEISNIIVDPVSCTGDGFYSLFVNFAVDNPSGNLFHVFSEGQFVGQFSYANLPVFIQQFPERDAEFDIITICDANNPDCCETIEFQGLECMEEEEPCIINNLEVDPIQCTGDGTYSLFVDFDFENPGNDSFDLYSGDLLVGTFAFSQVPLIVEAFPERDAELDRIVICVEDNEMCCEDLEFSGLDCTEELDCSITNIVVDPGQCTGDGMYSLFINFDSENTTNDFFEVYSAGIYLGIYAFADLPIVIEDFPERDAEYDIITICQNDDDSCCASLEFMGLDCMEDEGNCAIDNIVVDPVECTGDGFYSIFLNFDYENVTNDFFDVLAEGSIIGSFAYAELPVFIENFPESEAGFDFLVICDNDNPSCCTGYEFPGLECNADESCDINEVFAEITECNDEGEVYVDIEFNIDNPGQAGFMVRGNGIIYDTFEYGEPFYTVGPLQPDCMTIYEFEVIDISNPDCRGSFDFEEEICCDDEAPCTITEFFAEVYPCEENTDLVLIDIEFDIQNEGESGFTVRGNGMTYGTFEYGADYYTIGPVIADCETEYEFIITDIDNPDCSTVYFLEEPICCEEDISCDIAEVDILDAALINDIYVIVLDVEAEGTAESGFDIFINDQFFAFELYGSLPVILEVPAIEFESPFIITICDNDNPECCNEVEFELSTSVEESDPVSAFNIYTTGENLLVETGSKSLVNSYLLTMDGRQVHRETFRQKAIIPTAQFSGGIYVLRLETEGGVTVKRIFIP